MFNSLLPRFSLGLGSRCLTNMVGMASSVSLALFVSWLPLHPVRISEPITQTTLGLLGYEYILHPMADPFAQL